MSGFETVNRLIVCDNPRSSRPELSDYLINRLKSTTNVHGFEVVTLETSPDLDEMTERLRLLDIQPFDELCLTGGDGTKNIGLRAIYSLDLRNKTHLLGAGNADDLPNQLHPRSLQKRPELVVKFGSPRSLYPLHIQAMSNGINQDIMSFGYFGVGISANSGAVFNDEGIRSALGELGSRRFGNIRRQGREALLCLRSLRNAASNALTIETADDIRDSQEVLVPNGSRMAKRLRFPVDLLKPEAAILEAANPTVASALRALGRSATGRIVRFGQGEVKGFNVYSTLPHFLAQSDGEVTMHKSGTSFLISIAEQPVTVTTTKHV